MSSDHLNEPLDYLYEELPPERMAEVREHLAACPECREELREIRETVKAYRLAPRPAPPAGLAARAAARALREAGEPDELRDDGRERADGETVAAAPLLQEPAIDTNEAEFDRLKEEILGEKRGGWRLRLFHPGWAVAASVLFILSVLIHVSPRSNRWSADLPASTPVQHRELPPAPAMPAPEPLPEPTPAIRQQPTDFQPVPPILRQAEKLEKQLAKGTPRQEPAPELPSLSGWNDQTPAAASLDGALAGPGSVSIPALTEEAATPSEEAEQLFRDMHPPQAPAAAPKASLRPPSSVSGAMPKATTERDRAREPSATDAGPAPITLPPPGMSASETPGVVVYDLRYDAATPPQLIERPTPVDVEQSILNLGTLAGMHIALGEYHEARKIIDLLSRLDAEKARSLDDLLRKAQLPVDASEASTAAAMPYAAGVAAEAETAAPLSPPAGAPTATDKYYSPPASPGYNSDDAPASGGQPPDPAPSASEPISSAADAIPASAFDYPVVSSEPVVAPNVPKRSPDAVPPTLWESARRGRRPAADAAENGQSRPFTTDPYYRDR